MPNDLATRRFQEAFAWWLYLDQSLHRYRCWRLLYLSRTRIRKRLRRVLPALEGAIADARKGMLTASDNIWMSARCAVAAELAGKIFDEEHQERERDDDEPALV